MILLSIYRVAEGTRRPVAYEEVVVAAWKRFPQEFGLHGYIETYPDSSELHRHLYGLGRERLVRVQRHKLALTESGLVAAERCSDWAVPRPWQAIRPARALHREGGSVEGGSGGGLKLSGLSDQVGAVAPLSRPR
jgi:hypothetical protein